MCMNGSDPCLVEYSLTMYKNSSSIKVFEVVIYPAHVSISVTKGCCVYFFVDLTVSKIVFKGKTVVML